MKKPYIKSVGQTLISTKKGVGLGRPTVDYWEIIISEDGKTYIMVLDHDQRVCKMTNKLRSELVYK